MAPALVHFLVGASLALLFATPVALRYRLSPWWPLWIVVLGGIWGLGPDFHHVAPIYESKLYALHNSPRVDLFAFHYTLDRPFVRARATASIFGAIVCALGAASVFTAAAQLRVRTAVAESRVPQGVAAAVALALLLSLVAAMGGGFPAAATRVSEFLPLW